MSLMCDGNLDGGWANLGGCLRTSTSKIIYTFFCKKASSFIPSEKGQTGNYINGATVENRDSTATFVHAFNLCHVILLKAERQKVRLTWTENSSTSEGTFRIYKLRMFSEDPAFFFFAPDFYVRQWHLSECCTAGVTFKIKPDLHTVFALWMDI